MNVKQMLPKIRDMYPLAKIVDEFETKPFEVIQVVLENGWTVGLGYGRSHYCDNRFQNVEDPAETTTVEIAIFYPSGKWYVPEGAAVGAADETGVLGWQDSEQVFKILEYISGHEGGVQCQDTGGS